MERSPGGTGTTRGSFGARPAVARPPTMSHANGLLAASVLYFAHGRPRSCRDSEMASGDKLDPVLSSVARLPSERGVQARATRRVPRGVVEELPARDGAAYRHHRAFLRRSLLRTCDTRTRSHPPHRIPRGCNLHARSRRASDLRGAALDRDHAVGRPFLTRSASPAALADDEVERAALLAPRVRVEARPSDENVASRQPRPCAIAGCSERWEKDCPCARPRVPYES